MTDTTTAPRCARRRARGSGGCGAAARRTAATRTTALLEAVADALDATADELVARAREESGLPEGRLRGELLRTTVQLRFFASAPAGPAGSA